MRSVNHQRRPSAILVFMNQVQYPSQSHTVCCLAALRQFPICIALLYSSDPQGHLSNAVVQVNGVVDLNALLIASLLHRSWDPALMFISYCPVATVCDHAILGAAQGWRHLSARIMQSLYKTAF